MFKKLFIFFFSDHGKFFLIKQNYLIIELQK
jgi:hypothetical protein